MNKFWSTTMKFWLQVVCLLIYRGGDAFILPSQSIVVRQVENRRFSSGVDDLPETIYATDAGSLRESLESMRHSISSIQESIETTRYSLDAATSMTISKATSSIAEKTETDEAANILKEAMKQVKSSPDDGYFQASVGSMRDSLLSIQQSIDDVKQIHSSALSVSPVGEASHSVPVLTDYVVSNTHMQPVVEEVSRNGGIWIGDIIHKLESMNAAATTEYNNQLRQGMSKFVENASAESTAIAANAKIKLSMMVSNTYLMLGLEPPESMAHSGSPVTASVSLLAAFFAVLWAFGSKEMARKQTEENFKLILREHEKQQVFLKSQMAPLRVEITRLTGNTAELKTEIQETHMKIERLEFRRGLERQYWASKLRAKRRRVHRMRSQLESKHAKMEKAQVHQLETKRRKMHALRILAEKGRLVFGKSGVEIVSHLSGQIV